MTDSTGNEHERLENLVDHARQQVEAARAANDEAKLAALRSEGEQAPDRVGRFRILRRIGSGGMGVVYEAEQEEPIRRRVALKLIKPGMDTEGVIARFEAERQALAVMDHPGIARVIDAGATESGRPYFVMELVRGEPITKYCDRHRLSTRKRLGIFAEVCQAIQHAHQKGIIHRDIKPSNVLVGNHDGRAVPKVIDFGVAKATQPSSEHPFQTQHGQLVGTPEYMSPEQAAASGVDIDTRTDIYSLGTLLYELLTGTLPFAPSTLRKAGLAEIQRIIQEEEPAKPSLRVGSAEDSSIDVATKRRTDVHGLSRIVRGDLDWIVMKALEKDRAMRYVSASAFAEDIERHLRNEPVMAGPPSANYRFRKFVRRNRGQVAAVVGIVVILMAAVSGMTWQALETKRLLAQSYAQSARLAARRGDWQTVLENDRKALAAGYGDPIELQLSMVEAWDALNEMPKMYEMIAKLAARSDLGQHKGKVLLWQGDSVLVKDAVLAVPMIEKAIACGLSVADEFYARAMVSETLPESVAYLEQATGTDPYHGRALARLSVSYFFLGELEKARQLSQVCQRMFPEDPAYYIVEAMTYATMGDQEKAKTTLHRPGVKIGTPEREFLEAVFEVLSVAHTLLQDSGLSESADGALLKITGPAAALVFKAKQLEGLTADQNSALPNAAVFRRFPPTLAGSWERIAGVMTINLPFGQYERASETLLQVIEDNPEGSLLTVAGKLYARMGDSERAISLFMKATHAPSIFGVQRFALGRAIVEQFTLVTQEHGEDGRERLRSMIREYLSRWEPSAAESMKLADISSQLGDHDMARALLLRLRSTDPDGIAIRLSVARLEFEAGAYGPAIEGAVDVLSADPANEEAMTMIQKAKEHLRTVGPPGHAAPIEVFLREKGVQRQEP